MRNVLCTNRRAYRAVMQVEELVHMTRDGFGARAHLPPRLTFRRTPAPLTSLDRSRTSCSRGVLARKARQSELPVHLANIYIDQ